MVVVVQQLRYYCNYNVLLAYYRLAVVAAGDKVDCGRVVGVVTSPLRLLLLLVLLLLLRSVYMAIAHCLL